MKSINEYIQEKLIIKKRKYNYFPKTKEELQDIIYKRIEQEGPEVNLNDIDTSNIIDMSNLFEYLENFNGDISNWNVSNVTNMNSMFYGCEQFNQDLSEWDVSKVKEHYFIFINCGIQDKYKPKFK